ncbi:MAG: cation:proton antiporter, partial [Leptolyngbyaceae cyanobacterium]
MLASLIWMVGAGFLGGQLARRLGAPPLVGMILVGIGVGPELGDRLSPDLLDLADALRTTAVMVILMRAGLGLDREKLVQQGSVAIRLGFLPALTEAIAVMAIAMLLFQFDWLTGLLLGCIVGAESPAVIVPGMLRLKRLGWGVAKGIPDVILTGSALSDVLLLLLFSLLINILTQGQGTAQFGWLPLQVLGQIGLGTMLG